MSAEFQFIGRATDSLVKASLPRVGDFLVLIELLMRYRPVRTPRRIRCYAGLAEEKYQLKVYPVLVNIMKPGSVIVGCTTWFARSPSTSRVGWVNIGMVGTTCGAGCPV